MSAGPFGFIDRLIHCQGTTGQAGKELQGEGFGPAWIVPPYLGCRGDGTGIDHRVAGNAGAWIQADGVERIARGLHPHLFLHERRGEQAQRQPIHKGLGDRLDREGLLPVPHGINPAIGRCQNDSKILWIRFGQLGDVVSHRALTAVTQVFQLLLKQLLDQGGADRCA